MQSTKIRREHDYIVEFERAGVKFMLCVRKTRFSDTAKEKSVA